jgi:kynureninase
MLAARLPAIGSLQKNAKAIFNYLADNGVIGDWREPDVIRLSPVPLYNSYKQVFEAGGALAAAADKLCS